MYAIRSYYGYLDINLRKEYNRCERWGKSLSLCMIDIDNFKKINDTKGHPFGDQVLMRVATVLKNTVRDEDVLCRYGGEEFVITSYSIHYTKLYDAGS